MSRELFEGRAELLAAARPLIKYLAENKSKSTIAVVSFIDVELYEGTERAQTYEFMGEKNEEHK